MKRIATVMFGCVALAWLSGAPVAGAAQDPARGARPGARAGQAQKGPVFTPQDLERLFDSYELLQAQEALKLSVAQFPAFLGKLKVLQDTRRRNLQGRRQLLLGIGKLLKGAPPDEAQVREQLKALRDLDARAVEEMRRVSDGLDEVLDVVQQARFRIFEEMIERKKIDLLMRARQAATDAARPQPGPLR